MQGERVYPHMFGRLRLREGQYGKDLKGRWYVRPVGEKKQFEVYSVTEHDDKTITVLSKINGHGLILMRGTWSIGK